MSVTLQYLKFANISSHKLQVIPDPVRLDQKVVFVAHESSFYFPKEELCYFFYQRLHSLALKPDQ